MLVITRAIGEVFTIREDGTEIGVLGISGNEVRIGIIATKDRSIVRNELLEHAGNGTGHPAGFRKREGDEQ